MSFVPHIWAASAVGRLPADFEDAKRQCDELGGKQARSRPVFERLGKALIEKFGAQSPAFDDDPSDWGADMMVQCPAVWNLTISEQCIGEVLPFLVAKAVSLGLVVLDPKNAIFHKPKVMPEPALKLESKVHVEDNRIVGVLTVVPSRIETIEQAVGDALADALSRHGFKRALPAQFERRFADGILNISISASVIDDQSVKVDVTVDVTFTVVRKLLESIGQLEGSYPRSGPCISSPLQLLASSSEATRRLFKGREPDRNTLIVKDAVQARQRVNAEIVPMLLVVTGEKSPWFQNPNEVTDLFLQFYLEKNQAVAGFEFVCMEDLILTQMFSAKHFERLFRKRIEIEQRYAAEVPRPPRWNSIDGLQRVHAFAAKHVAPDSGLKSLPRETSRDVDTDDEDADPVQDRKPRGLALAGVALALGLTILSWVWKGSITPIALVVSAIAIFFAASAVTQKSWLKWVLRLTVFLLPLHAVVLCYLAYRLLALPASPAR